MVVVRMGKMIRQLSRCLRRRSGRTTVTSTGAQCATYFHSRPIGRTSRVSCSCRTQSPWRKPLNISGKRIDADPVWIEAAAFSDAEGRPFSAVKRAPAEYVGGPEEICLTSNTTNALAMAYHGLRIRQDQEILTTEHDHYSHHESIRFAATRSGCNVRYVSLYDRPSAASASEIVDRITRAISPKTRAVGVTWVHSSTGLKIPIANIADAVQRATGRAAADRCLLIVDGVHGFANQDVDIAQLGCDLFATGTHKWLFGPRGTGFLWGRKDVWPDLRPTIPSFDPDAPQTWAAWMEHAIADNRSVLRLSRRVSGV